MNHLVFDDRDRLAELDTDAFGDEGEPRNFPVLVGPVKAWCKTNLRGGYELEHDIDWRDYGNEIINYCIMFDHEIDALMFRMKWL